MKPLTRKDLDKWMDAHVLRDGVWCRKTSAKLGTDEIPRLVLLVEEFAWAMEWRASTGHGEGKIPDASRYVEALKQARSLLRKEGR